MPKLKIINHLAFWGLVVSILGTFLTISDGMTFFNRIYDRKLPCLIHLNKGLNTLSTLDPALDEKFLAPDEKGFKEILNVIKINLPGVPIQNVRGITCKKVAKILIGNQELPFLRLFFLDHGNAHYTVVGFDSTLRSWVKNYRQDLFLSSGLWLILFGFVISAFCYIRFDSNEKQKTSQSLSKKDSLFIPPTDKRDIYIARYGHLNAEITRYRDLVWKVVFYVWGIYGALLWFFFEEKASQIHLTNSNTNFLLSLFFAAACIGLVSHFYFEAMVIANQNGVPALKIL